jgi:hypothetical protein
MFSPVRMPRAFSKGKRSGSKSNVHDESRDHCSGLPTLQLDSGSEEAGSVSSRRLASRSPKKASQEKENSSPKKSLSHFRLAPPRADKRRQEEPTTPKKSPAKLVPSRAGKRYEFEFLSTSSRAHSDRNMNANKMNSSTPPSTPPTTRRDRAPVNQGSPAKTLSSMDDFFTEYAKIMDEFPEKRKRKGKKTSSSVIGW